MRPALNRVLIRLAVLMVLFVLANAPLAVRAEDLKDESIDGLLLGYYIWAKPEYAVRR